MRTAARLARILMVWCLGIAGGALSFGQDDGRSTDRKTSQDFGVEVTVKALDFTNGTAESQRFEVEFTTHTAKLDFDLTQVALLGDEKGELVLADSWTGGRGGHHLAGILGFPGKPLLGFRSLQLVLDLPDLGKRVFFWSLEPEGTH